MNTKDTSNQIIYTDGALILKHVPLQFAVTAIVNGTREKITYFDPNYSDYQLEVGSDKEAGENYFILEFCWIGINHQVSNTIPFHICVGNKSTKIINIPNYTVEFFKEAYSYSIYEFLVFMKKCFKIKSCEIHWRGTILEVLGDLDAAPDHYIAKNQMIQRLDAGKKY